MNATAYEHGADDAIQAYLIRCALSETLPQAGDVSALTRAGAQVFPVKAADLMPAYQGAALGARLAALKASWIESDFALDKAELLGLPTP